MIEIVLSIHQIISGCGTLSYVTKFRHVEAARTKLISPKYASTHIPLHSSYAYVSGDEREEKSMIFISSKTRDFIPWTDKHAQPGKLAHEMKHKNSICGTVISTPAGDLTRFGGPQFKIGDEVLGMLSYTRDGGAAHYALATEDEIALKPVNISTVEAASVVTLALVAWQALARYCATSAPETTSQNSTSSEPTRVLVINADDNNIGRIAIQLPRAKNACLPFSWPWICAVCKRQGSEALMSESGVHEVLVIPPFTSQTIDLAATKKMK